MTDAPTTAKSSTPIIILLAVLWTGVVASSLAWNFYKTSDQLEELARNEALAMFNKDQAFRLWGTRHGGVYAPVKDDTQPSPYLGHIPERDIETPSGKKLTLMNPAFMVRQLMEDYNDLYGTKGHITGLVLLRPENKPDKWEEKALHRFIENGDKEVSEFTLIDGKPFLRLMRPMIMQKGCEKCHGHLGFREGDIRGGVSVAVPLESYNNRKHDQYLVLSLTHSSVWVMGLLLIGFGGRKIQSSISEIIQAEEEVRTLNQELETRVDERTKKLNEKEQRLRKTVENAADGIIVIDANGTIDTFNAAAQQIFGYQEDEIIGQNITIIMPKHHANHHQDYINTHLRTGQSHILGSSREVEAIRKNGQHFPLNLAVNKIETDDKILFSAICRDLSEQKQNAHELMEAKAEAERASLAKSEFLSSMSHELRTPLNSIIGFSQLLGLDTLGDKQKKHVDQISGAGQHLLTLINDILDLSRIETQGFSLSIEAVDLKKVVKNCLNLAGPAAQKRKIRIYDDLTIKELPKVRADFVRLKQVLMNLLSNASKYNIEGGQISINAAVQKHSIRISVTDTGPGIAKHQIEALFEPFNRLGQESSTIEGTGIGLSITRKLVEMMDGKIGVESTLGKGSTFWVEIPISSGDEKEKDHKFDDDNINAPISFPTRNCRVIYVDDNSHNLELMSEIFAGYKNIEFITAKTGEEGLSLINDLIPDLAFIDIHLPGIDGIETAQQLQSSTQTKEIPLVAVSANLKDEEKQRSLNAGFLTFLEKPFNVRECLSIISKILNK